MNAASGILSANCGNNCCIITYAMATLEAAGFVTIALSPEDLRVIQRKAQEAGVSSQQLIADIVHQFVVGNPD